MISMKDYEDEQGNMDWSSYKQAQISCGDICYKCNSYIISINSPGYSKLCQDCEDLSNNSGSIRHDSYYRCPYCRYSESVHNSELYELYKEGEHEIYCSNCDKIYCINTIVKYIFESPEIEVDD